MYITKLKVFSFFYNCRKCFSEGVDIKNLNSLVNTVHYNRQGKYIMEKCSNIVRRIRSNNFSFFQYKVYILYLSIFKDTVNWNDIDLNDIIKIARLFTSRQFQKDKDFLLQLNKKLSFENINFLYKVNANGNNIMLDLVLKNKISPYTYMKLYREDIYKKYISSITLNRINRITEMIKN
jgi:hypothetical protein